MTKPTAIAIDHVTVRREGQVVIDDASLGIDRGTVHVVVGPNGGGKSTLLAAVLGQIPFTGTIEVTFHGAGTVGYVPQSFVADRTLPITVAEFLALSRQRRPVCLGIGRATRARIAEILAAVDLEGFERRRIGELSGGELRRVLIGNAIDPAPELLLCDEPAAGLDPDSAERLDQLLLDLRERHRTTILLVSHDRAQVHRIADRVTRFERTVQNTGRPADVMASAEGDVP